MKKLYPIFIIALLLQLTARAELRSGHFFKTLQKENLTEQKAVECFDQWFELPQETEWRKVSERTDKLGITRIEYRQYVSGVEVEHSQVLLHMKDGRVQTANGTVMEAPHMPAKLRRGSAVYKNGTPTDLLGRTLYLVSTKDGYRYATKVLSPDGSEWIYTDADTDEVLKRIPTRHNLTAKPAKVTGWSIYSGDVQMDASRDSESGTYILWDQQRNIHTMIGATIPSLEQMINEHTLIENIPDLEPTLPVPEEEMTEEMWNEWLNTTEPTIDLSTVNMLSFAGRNAFYASSTKRKFDSYVLNTITIDRLTSKDDEGNLTEIVPTEDNPLTLFAEIHYYYTDGIIEQVQKTITGFPFTLDLKEYNDEIPAAGVNIVFYAIVKDETSEEGDLRAQYLTYLTLEPNTSGRREWNYDDVKASATYRKGPWSAVDIHWGMQHTYDFYLNTFDRNSYDDNGAPILNLFYLPYKFDPKGYYVTTPLNNAMADPSGPYMVYGMGNRVGGIGSMYPVVELSIMAHEFTHLVTYTTANLVYQGESGALNESFSDLLGISVKKYVQGDDATWTIGEGVMEYASNLRSMSFPKTSTDGKMPCPDTYQGEFWEDTEDEANDYGGVHTNSGVQNKWYYLLTDGDSGTNDNDYSYQVTGIGIDKSQQIAYRTLVEYATEESQYADIRLASLQAAEDLYGANSEEVKTVDEAWKAVGVGGTQTAIREIENGQLAKCNEAVYNLAGQMVNGKWSNGKLTKGIYIVNGKKVLK